MTNSVPGAVIKTLTAFISKVTRYAARGQNLKCYRGQRDTSWENVPGLFRHDLSRLESNERRATRDLMAVHPHEFATDQTMFDRLVRMQHFGLPTRLMDVSLNPLVALYFATDPGPDGKASDGVVTAFAVPESREKYYDSDAVSCIANLANLDKDEKDDIVEIRRERKKGATWQGEIARSNAEDVYKKLHQFIRAEKSYFLPLIHPIDLFKPFYVHPKMSNRRILAQAGGFIVYGLKPPRSIKFAEEFKETKFIVPEASKPDLRRSLELLGITDSTLFPEIDRAAKRIEAKYR
ncbi:FRG domain-containing protein [Bosea sp. (in: a-proteobacteria)]|uniref:FRG domain-containing protein n=1 Tax=Bosea sp. (in: a-proteobacteria) TaxID=1871050 RepID=UPI0027345257|nr:FRG domain-containing protein [Bosea sp. (in: a-proteobacteria)]MDP3410355.1 FRG domain-containing protein [Bosea sp. (in: a-proteobacteria)]